MATDTSPPLDSFARADLLMLVADLLRSPAQNFGEFGVPDDDLDEFVARLGLRDPSCLGHALRSALALVQSTDHADRVHEYTRLFDVGEEVSRKRWMAIR